MSGIPLRRGTRNYGLKYESQVMTLQAACITNNVAVADFEMISNPAEVNDFEDIILKVNYKNKEPVMYVMQLKHSTKTLQIANNKKDLNKKSLGIDLSKYFISFQEIREIVRTTNPHKGELQEFLRSVKFENYYFCFVTTTTKIDNDIKLIKIDISSNQDLKLLHMAEYENCYQLDTTVFSSEQYNEFPQKFYIFLNQPDHANITQKLTEILQHYTQPMADNLYKLIGEQSFDSEEYKCKILNKEMFCQLCMHVIFYEGKSIYNIKIKPIDENYAEVWDKVCSNYQFICIDENRTEDLLPLIAAYYECKIRKYTNIGDQNPSVNHQFTWNDCHQKNFKLDDYLKKALSIKGIKVDNLNDLLLEMWKRNAIPIVVQKPIAHYIMDLAGLNIKNRFFIISADNTPSDGNDKLKIFSNLLDIRDGPANDIFKEIMSIQVSLQEKDLVSLKDIVRDNQKTLQLISSSDLLSWIAKELKDREIGSSLKRHIENYIPRKFRISNNDKLIEEADIVRELNSYNLTIISDGPGTGKTTVLTSLARYSPSRYTTLIDLAQCKIDLEDANNAIHRDPIRYFSNKQQMKKSALVEGILEQHLEEKNLIIFLDSFDEILPLHQKRVHKIINTILSTEGTHLFVTSRTQAKDLLLKFDVKSRIINLVDLDKNEISKHFEKHNVPEDVWGRYPETLLSTPLHLTMLIEIGTLDNAKDMNETKHYELFINKKISIFYDKKGINDECTRNAMSLCLDGIYEAHYIIALVYLFGLGKIIGMKIVTIQKWDEIMSNFIDNKLALGLVSTINPIQFIHKTYAEYLAAAYISKYPEKSIELYKDVVTNIDLNKTYKFLHEMRSLDIQQETIEACITNSKDKEILEIVNACHSWNKRQTTWGMYPVHWAAVCCFLTSTSRTVNMKPFDILLIILDQKSKQTTDDVAFDDVNLKDDHLCWNWLNFLTGHESNNYSFYKHLICLQTTADLNVDLKNRIKENINIQYIDNTGCTLGQLAASNCDKEVFDYVTKSTLEFNYSHTDKLGRNILHHACLGGKLEIVDSLIDIKPTSDFIQAQDNYGYNPLHYACEKGNQELVEFLLKHGCDVNTKNNDGRTPFHLACDTKNINLVERLIESNADVNATFGDEARSPLHEACLQGRLDLATVLLKEKRCNHSQTDTDGTNALQFAAAGGNVQIIEAVINMGMSPDYVDELQQTPLHFACGKGHYEAAKYLVNKGVNPSSIAGNGRNSLHKACAGEKSGAKRIVDFFLDNNLIEDINATDEAGWDALHCACGKGNRAVVEDLLKRGFNVNKKSNDRTTPFHLACKTNDPNLVKCLITSADLNATFGNEERTALHEACSLGNIDIVNLLLKEERCNYLKSSADGRNALHFGASAGNVEILDVLINKGIDTDILDSVQKSPLHYACVEGRYDAVRCLLDKGANPSLVDQDGRNSLHHACSGERRGTKDIDFWSPKAKDKEGWNTLHYACDKGNQEEVENLLHDFDVNKKSNDGITPFHLACMASINNPKLVECLIKKNPNMNATFGNEQRTALHVVCFLGNLSVFNLLLENGCNLNQTDANGNKALHYASAAGNVEIIEALINKGVNLNDLNAEQKTPLYIASVRGQHKAADYLLEKRANPLSIDEAHGSSLHQVCAGEEHGAKDIVDFLLDNKLIKDEKATDKNGWDALQHAYNKGNRLIADDLLKRGFNPN